MIYCYTNINQEKFYDSTSIIRMLNISRAKFLRTKKLIGIKHTELKNKHLLRNQDVLALMEVILCEKIKKMENELSKDQQFTRQD
jgi:hypothetical protein